MTKSGAKEEEKVEAGAASAKVSSEGTASGGTAAVHKQLATVVRDLEEIRSTADRGLQSLASLAPAIEELSGLLSQLQRSFLRFQDGDSAPGSEEKEPERPRTLSLRVERAEGSLDVEATRPAGLRLYARLCGWTLARAHARSGDPVAIAAYLGKSDQFDKSIARFAREYADQNEEDYRVFRDAIRSGRIEAKPGL